MAEFTETVTTTRTVACPVCESGRVIKAGIQSGEQRYLCHACGTRFRAGNKALGRRMSADQVGAAIRMFYSGMSYKQIAENMEKMYDIPEPSKATIYEWVRDYTEVALEEMKDHPAEVGDSWVVDEMQLSVGGEKYWNWNVMDEKTRYILASYISKERNAQAAATVLKKAANAAANPPAKVKTDKLRSYVPAMKTVFLDAEHVQSEGIRNRENNNNLSERLQGTFRQRTKTLRGLDSRETGQLYLDGWVITYNLFRGHEALDNKAPGRVANVDVPFTEWADVVKGAHSPKGAGPVENNQHPNRPPIPKGVDVAPPSHYDTGRPQIPAGVDVVDVVSVSNQPPKRKGNRKTPPPLKPQSGRIRFRRTTRSGVTMPAEIKRFVKTARKR